MSISMPLPGTGQDGRQPDEEPYRHRWQTLLAVAAVLTAVPVAVWAVFLNGPGGVPLAVAPFVATPLFHRRASAFRRSCLSIGATLTVLGVLGVFFGLGFFLPSAVILFLAPGADPRRGRVRARILAGAAGLTMAGMAAVTAMLIWAFTQVEPLPTGTVEPAASAEGEPAAYVVELAPGTPYASVPERHSYDFLGMRGVTSHVDGVPGDHPKMRVWPPQDFSLSDEAHLKEALAALPGARKVAVCPPGQC
ncbi:hypothetical protein [Streptomyces sp. NPDC007100]|uniref:hypothetical protein n=1 Tax=Streptomyces sp. NPDC007100 TaxID=3155602 RepID=UPI0033D08B0A